MKRAAFILSFALLGLIFVFLVQAVVVNVLDHGMNQFELNSDERGEHQLKTLLIAGPLFLAIGSYIGNAASQSYRTALAMTAGVLAATLISFGVPGLHGPLANIFNFSGNSLGLLTWGLLSAALSFVSGKLLKRPVQN